ncbi:MAG: protein kinase [Pyrinomonadaceae bacterium]|nr:protein kinase [Pyrinomonadaceae bacterium]
MITPGTTLLNYRILEKIGAGGQGTVYKALDKKLGRTVVIKVLPPELTTKEANLKRFEREARLASALDHPNICTIFDLNTADGLHFIVMQYVEGKNVRQLVAGRPLELKSALLITIQVADALASAHKRGIIHRDIKAGNVMVTSQGQVKILDFGLAKLVDETQARDSGIHHTELTEIGVPYGTATYAAPEQARGDRVDHRADIFSTGVLLYELLTGIWPFQGKTSVDVRHAVLHATPRPIAEMRNDPVPPRLQQILDRALAKDPRERYQKISDMRDDLKSVLREVTMGTSSAIDITEGGTGAVPRHLSAPSPMARALRWLRNITGTEPPTQAPSTYGHQTSSPRDFHETPLTSVPDQEKKSIAILPFRNLSNDPASSFYEFALADAVITELAQLRSLVVRPSSLISKYQGNTEDPREIGRELDVSAVLAASFLRAGDRLRVTAQLLDVDSGNMMWSDRFDVSSEDVIKVQDTIAQHIVEKMRVELSPDEQGRLTSKPTDNAEAYEEYLRGRDAFGRFVFRTVSREDCDEACERFTRAIELDPNFALAYSGLGACYANRVFKGFGSAEDYERAEEAFNKATAIDPEVVEARMLMVFIYLSRGEKKKAREAVARLRQKAPNHAAVYFVKAVVHRLDGEYDRALRSWDKLATLDPAARVVAAYNRARIFWYQGMEDQAMDELDRASAIEPDHPLVKTFRARILFYRGEYEIAAELLREVLAERPKMNGIRPILAMCLSKLGQHEAARAELSERVLESAAADHDIAYWTASVYALENERDEAFKWLERAIELGNENRKWFETDSNWASLRDDPRFKELMERIDTKKKMD